MSGYCHAFPASDYAGTSNVSIANLTYAAQHSPSREKRRDTVNPGQNDVEDRANGRSAPYGECMLEALGRVVLGQGEHGRIDLHLISKNTSVNGEHIIMQHFTFN